MPAPDHDNVTHIPIAGRTKVFMQGVSAAQKVRDAHAGSEFGDFETQIGLFWFYVGALAVEEYHLTEQEDLADFIMGASLRKPEPPDPDDGEG